MSDTGPENDSNELKVVDVATSGKATHRHSSGAASKVPLTARPSFDAEFKKDNPLALLQSTVRLIRRTRLFDRVELYS